MTAHLAEHGVDVLGLEVVDRGRGCAVDDLLLSGDGARRRRSPTLGAAGIVLARRPGVDLRDPALAMAAACEAVSSAPQRPRRRTGASSRAALGLVFAEAGLVCVRREDGFLAVAASTVAGPAGGRRRPRALAAHLGALQRRAPDRRRPRAVGPAGAAATCCPAARSRSSRPAPLVARARLVRDDHAPFVAAELDRLAALVRAALARCAARDAPSTASDAAGVSRMTATAHQRVLIAEDETIIRLDLRSTARGERLRGLRRGARRRRGGRARGVARAGRDPDGREDAAPRRDRGGAADPRAAARCRS